MHGFTFDFNTYGRRTHQKCGVSFMKIAHLSKIRGNIEASVDGNSTKANVFIPLFLQCLDREKTEFLAYIPDGRSHCAIAKSFKQYQDR